MTSGELGQVLLSWWMIASGILFNVLIVVIFFARIALQVQAAMQIRRFKRRERKAEKRMRDMAGPGARWIDAEILPPPPREKQGTVDR